MNKSTYTRAVHGLLVGLLGSLLSLSGSAFAQLVEAEPNDTATGAPLLCIPSGGVTVSASMGNGAALTSELDIFAFDATAGDAPRIAIVTDPTQGWDSLLTLYDEAGNFLDSNDDSIDANGNLVTDSRIDAYGIQTSGRYFAVVTAVPNYLTDNFTPRNPGTSGLGGPYTLEISNVTASSATASISTNGSCATTTGGDPTPVPTTEPPVDDTGPTVISMEVLHWRNQDGDVAKRWKHHLKRKGKRNGIYPIPVVMFSSDTFTATDIDPSTLTFGAFGDEDSLFRCSKRGMDVNKDGRKDMVCFFDAFKAGFDVGDVQGLLNGETVDGEAFTSSATLKVFKVSNVKDMDERRRRARHHHGHGHRHHDDHGKHKGDHRSRWSNQD